MKKNKKLQMLVKKIDDTRKYMYDIIDRNSNLTDAEVIEVSTMLDFLLNEYNNFLNKNGHAA